MILDSKVITALGAVLTKPPFSGSPELARSVWRILETGNRKHGTVRHPACEHAEHARRHLQHGGVDADSGEPAIAHAAARLLLALFTISRGE
jgi:hypothetical protein